MCRLVENNHEANKLGWKREKMCLFYLGNVIMISHNGCKSETAVPAGSYGGMRAISPINFKEETFFLKKRIMEIMK